MSQAEIFALFKCRVTSCKYYFRDGSVAYFTEGRFATKNEKQIAELKEEIEAGHPHIYIDEKESTAESMLQDPMSTLRAKMFKEFLAQQEAAKLADTGTTDNSAGAGAGISTSSLLQRVQANSNSK